MAAVLATLFLGYAAYRLFGSLEGGTWPMLGDSVIFEYIGWFLTEGNRLYVDVWEVKPPLSFEVTAVLSLLAGDDVVRYHVLNLLANGAAIVVGAAAAAGIVYHLTDDALGAVVAGVTPFVLPTYFFRALIGFKAKYFVVAAGLGCLYLAYRERPVAAGVAGVVAVGFWQFAAVFPLAALGLSWQVRGRDGAIRVLAGGVATGVIVLLPVVLWGAVPAMIAEAILVPLVVTDGHTFRDQMQRLVLLLGKALPVVLVGLAGIAGGMVSDRIRREWPIALAAAWFTVQMIAFDLDGWPDLFPWLAVVSIGVGMVVANRHRPGNESDAGGQQTANPWSGRRALAAGVLLLVTLSVVTMGGFGTGNTSMTDPDTFDTDTQFDSPLLTTYPTADERQYVYWNRLEISSCRAFGGATQARIVRDLEIAPRKPWYRAPCGQFDPVWDAFRSEYGI